MVRPDSSAYYLVPIVLIIGLLFFYFTLGRREPVTVSPAPVYSKQIALLPVKAPPATLPADYQDKMNYYKETSTAQTGVERNSFLKGVTQVQIIVTLSGQAKKIVDEETLRAQLEISLKRSGIEVVQSGAAFVLCYSLETQQRENLCVFNSNCNLLEKVMFARQEQPLVAGYYQVWNADLFGSVGMDGAKAAFIRQVIDDAQKFQSAWASENGPALTTASE